MTEMHCLSGSVSFDKTNHQVAYCAQNPCRCNLWQWLHKLIEETGLEHATIRDNIIFGSTRGFDPQRYEVVLHGCALVKDLEMFDAGDATGQTAWVNTGMS
jgi:hypothetical protein